MTEHDLNPMAQAEVEAEIRRLVRRLTEVTEEYIAKSTEAAKADVAYKLRQAKEMIALRNTDLTVAAKEAEALVACASEYEAMVLGAAVAKGLVAAAANLRSQLDALRSINANVRSLVANPGGTGW